MPSTSKAQKGFMGMEYGKAKAGLPTETGMAPDQLKDFASTPMAGLPEHVKKKHHHKKHDDKKGGGAGMVGAGRQPGGRGGNDFKPRGGSFY